MSSNSTVPDPVSLLTSDLSQYLHTIITVTGSDEAWCVDCAIASLGPRPPMLTYSEAARQSLFAEHRGGAEFAHPQGCPCPYSTLSGDISSKAPTSLRTLHASILEKV
jgi:hypothetical protein